MLLIELGDLDWIRCRLDEIVLPDYILYVVIAERERNQSPIGKKHQHVVSKGQDRQHTALGKQSVQLVKTLPVFLR